jgi:hypothetical protein
MEELDDKRLASEKQLRADRSAASPAPMFTTPTAADQATRTSSTGTSSRHNAGVVIARTPRTRRSDGAVSER